jgi:hypothetical protein
MIATASLTMPYPKITENNFGCSEGLINVKAATESVALIVALNFIIRAVERMMVCPCLPMGVIH